MKYIKNVMKHVNIVMVQELKKLIIVEYVRIIQEL